MTDGPTGGPTAGKPLTPDQEDRVARLLADAAGPVRVPADVAARLDDVLADLVAERAAPAVPIPSEGHGSDELAHARARRRWPRALLAAAAVLVGGYAVGTVATQGTLVSGDSAQSADSGAGSERSMAQEDSLVADGAEPKDQDGGAAGDVESAPTAKDSNGMAFLTAVRLRPGTLERDVRRALRLLDTAQAPLSRQGLADSTCPGPPLDERERSLSVRYDGEPAVLVAGPERGGSVDAAVHSCEGELLVRTRVRR